MQPTGSCPRLMPGVRSLDVRSALHGWFGANPSAAPAFGIRRSRFAGPRLASSSIPNPPRLDGLRVSCHSPLSTAVQITTSSPYTLSHLALLRHSPSRVSHPYRMSIQRRASASVTRPKYTWVVRRFWCRSNTFETISSGTPVRLANVAACRRRS